MSGSWKERQRESERARRKRDRESESEGRKRRARERTHARERRREDDNQLADNRLFIGRDFVGVIALTTVATSSTSANSLSFSSSRVYFIPRGTSRASCWSGRPMRHVIHSVATTIVVAVYFDDYDRGNVKTVLREPEGIKILNRRIRLGL